MYPLCVLIYLLLLLILYIIIASKPVKLQLICQLTPITYK